MPWKNGRGSTLQIASDAPPGGDEWSWRLSIAEVPERAAFSPFPGVDRLIARLHGNGLALEWNGRVAQVPATGPALAFAGEEQVTGVPDGGGVRDVNLMMRRQRWRGAMRVVRGGPCAADAPLVLVHAATGSASLVASAEPGAASLREGETLVTRGRVEIAAPPAAVVVVCELHAT
jgi:environmental stress-induced protein Ves